MEPNIKISLLKAEANKLPLEPGVYIMKNSADEIIYVGKAKALKNRVSQYFGSSANHTTKVIKMVENIDHFETIICDSEYEALMLENSLIKQHQPKYNILLKDDKGYHYVKITAGKWPKIETAKQIVSDGSEYIGPYYSSSVIKGTVDEANKIFKLPTCNRSFDISSKPCLNYHIGLCSAPCKIKHKHDEYLSAVNGAKNYIINGGASDGDIDSMRKRMVDAAENLDFELAARLRDRIASIERSREKQKVIISNHKRQDIFATAMAGDKTCVSIFVFCGGHLSDKKSFFLDCFTTKRECYVEFLLQYYQNSDIPPEIAVDTDFEDMELVELWLTELRGTKVRISVPQKGIQKQLVDMCLSNSAQALSDKIERSGRETAALNELAQLLGLKKVPRRIESYDISNTAGSENVGSMVVFTDGRPDKSQYRKFRIKSFVGQDDFRSLCEVLDRRFSEYIVGNDESFAVLPDLILLDGGKGQLSAVKPIFEKFGLQIPVFGMVKDSKHKTRAITAGGEDIQIKSNRKAFTLTNVIQDEVHRVAISYHRKRTKMSALQLELTEIDGVGEITAAKLLKTFKTLKNIKNATVEELIENGFSKKVSKNVYEFYKK